MRVPKFWISCSTLVAIAISSEGIAVGQVIPINATSPKIELNGTSGGAKKDASCAGFIAETPNHTIQVADDVNLTFTLKSAGQPALLIRSNSGNDFCVAADSFSEGEVKVPGRWRKGAYQIYVGDRANGRHSYTLAITRN